MYLHVLQILLAKLTIIFRIPNILQGIHVLHAKCYQQKVVRHELRVKYEFNISDFNVQGKAFGEEDLQAAIRRGAIQILDDATIAAMKEKRARDKARDEAARREQQAAEERN